MGAEVSADDGEKVRMRVPALEVEGVWPMCRRRRARRSRSAGGRSPAIGRSIRAIRFLTAGQPPVRAAAARSCAARWATAAASADRLSVKALPGINPNKPNKDK